MTGYTGYTGSDDLGWEGSDRLHHRLHHRLHGHICPSRGHPAAVSLRSARDQPSRARGRILAWHVARSATYHVAGLPTAGADGQGKRSAVAGAPEPPPGPPPGGGTPRAAGRAPAPPAPPPGWPPHVRHTALEPPWGRSRTPGAWRRLAGRSGAPSGRSGAPSGRSGAPAARARSPALPGSVGSALALPAATSAAWSGGSAALQRAAPPPGLPVPRMPAPPGSAHPLPRLRGGSLSPLPADACPCIPGRPCRRGDACTWGHSYGPAHARGDVPTAPHGDTCTGQRGDGEAGGRGDGVLLPP